MEEQEYQYIIPTEEVNGMTQNLFYGMVLFKNLKCLLVYNG